MCYAKFIETVILHNKIYGQLTEMDIIKLLHNKLKLLNL